MIHRPATSRWTAATILAAAVLAGACDTPHVQLKTGDCVSESFAAVGCGEARARFRVVDVVRREGAYASCAPTLSNATFTEGGDGPMIGVTVCLEAIAAAAPS